MTNQSHTTKYKSLKIFLIIFLLIVTTSCDLFTEKYSIVYEGNGYTSGAAPVDENLYRNGDIVSILSKGSLEKEGFSFLLWNTDKEGQGTPRIPGSTFFMGSSPVSLYAQWGINSYSVRYNGNGNTSGGVPSLEQLYEYNSKITVLDNINSLVKADFSFHGWNTKPDYSGEFFEPGNTFYLGAEDTTLYAVWNQIYPISYYLYNGENHEDNPSSYTSISADINFHSPTRTGYTFKGWYSDNSYSKEIKSIESGFSGPLELHAKWEANTYLVIFDSGEGINGTESVIATYGSVMPSGVEKPELADYIFEGYYEKEDGEGVQYYSSNLSSLHDWDKLTNSTIYARWERSKYTISYGSNKATMGDVPSSQIKNYKQSIELAENNGNLIKDWNTYGGWNTATDHSGTHYMEGELYNLNEDAMLYAQWELNEEVFYKYNSYVSSIAIDGNYAIIGSRGGTLGDDKDVGRAYLYHYDVDTGWSLKQTITASDGYNGDNFGKAVAIDNECLIIFGNTTNTWGEKSGTLYSYQIKDTTENTKATEQKIVPPKGEIFSNAVAINGSYMIISSSTINWNPSVYIYYKNGTRWGLNKKITPLDIQDNDKSFGTSVDIDGDYAIVGANRTSNDMGSAYIYHRNSELGWGEEYRILASDGADYDYFGTSVAIDGDYAIVGAIGEGGPYCNYLGSSYIYHNNGGTWREVQKLSLDTAERNDRFGSSVVIDGDYAMVDSPGDGNAYMFYNNGRTWEISDILSGGEVAIAGSQAVVGVTSDSGWPYMFVPEGKITFYLK